MRWLFLSLFSFFLVAFPPTGFSESAETGSFPLYREANRLDRAIDRADADVALLILTMVDCKPCGELQKRLSASLRDFLPEIFAAKFEVPDEAFDAISLVDNKIEILGQRAVIRSDKGREVVGEATAYPRSILLRRSVRSKGWSVVFDSDSLESNGRNFVDVSSEAVTSRVKGLFPALAIAEKSSPSPRASELPEIRPGAKEVPSVPAVAPPGCPCRDCRARSALLALSARIKDDLSQGRPIPEPGDPLEARLVSYLKRYHQGLLAPVEYQELGRYLGIPPGAPQPIRHYSPPPASAPRSYFRPSPPPAYYYPPPSYSTYPSTPSCPDGRCPNVP